MNDEKKDQCSGLNHHPCNNNVINRIAAVYPWMIDRGLSVGEMWLHPNQAKELLSPTNGRHCTAFDAAWFYSGVYEVNPEDLARHQEIWRGGRCIGHLYGANVVEHKLVPINHICVVPDGMVVENVSVCSFPF
jgi:hypothetical protein